MLLAGKVEETPRALKDVILVSYEIIHKMELDATERKEVYEQQKELVLSGEELVLSTLNFDLTVRHPYKPLVEAIKKHKVAEAKADFLEVAQRIVNNCLQKALSLQYKPHHIAAYGFFGAAKHLEMDLQGHREVLYREFDITLSQLEDIHGQLFGLDAWYFSREEIETNSPSTLDGIDLNKEAHLQKSYCKFLIDLDNCNSLHVTCWEG